MNFRTVVPSKSYQFLEHLLPTRKDGQIVERERLRSTKKIRKDITIYILNKEQKEHYTEMAKIEPGKNNENPIHIDAYATKYGSRLKERPKQRNCRYCNARIWNPNHKCPARGSTCHHCRKKVSLPKFIDLTPKTTKFLRNYGAWRHRGERGCQSHKNKDQKNT